MLADGFDDRPGADPFVGCSDRIIVVDGLPDGVDSVKRILGCAPGNIRNGLIELAVVDG